MQKVHKQKKITLGSCENKGWDACIKPIKRNQNENVNEDDIHYGDPVEDKNNLSNYKAGIYCRMVFNLTEIEDGYYEYNETEGGKKFLYGYLHIKDGEIIQKWDSWIEAIATIDPQAEKLPPLRGTELQIKSAEVVRQKALTEGFAIDKASKIERAADWLSARPFLNQL